MKGKSELIGENVVLRGDVDRLRERCRIKDAEIERLSALWIAETRQNEHLRNLLRDMLEPYKGMPARPPYFTEAVSIKIAAARAALDSEDQQSGDNRK